MYKDIYEFIKGFDLHTIIIVGVAFYAINARIDELDKRLSAKIEDIDRRLSRIEGAFSVRNVCLLNDGYIREKEENK